MLRHGQSEWNAIGRWQGQADPPLSDEGRRQSVAAGLVLGNGDDRWSSVWASDLQRAVSTADIIAEIIGCGPAELDQRLRETHVGPWEGLTHDEVNAGWPGFLDKNQRPDGFEPYDAAARRMIAALVDIAATSTGAVLVISHGGVTRATRRMLGAADARMPNLGGSWFGVLGDHVVAGDAVDLTGATTISGAL